MINSRNKLYSILGIACVAGYSWIYYGLTSIQASKGEFEACFIKQLTNIPCPSCGSTRSILSLMKGEFFEALMLNPLGYIIAFVLLLSPLWIVTDILTKRSSLFDLYQKAEVMIRKPQFAIPLLVLVALNWIWNITKGL